MGLFKKEKCQICGKELGIRKCRISDAWVCMDCIREIGETETFDIKHITLEQLIQKKKNAEKKKIRHEKMLKQNPMQTAEGMFQFCSSYGYNGNLKKNAGIKYFSLIENTLDEEEKVLTVFVGLHNYHSVSKHEGSCAYAITNQRFIMAQKSPMMGDRLLALPYDEIMEIRYMPGGMIEAFSVETEEGILSIGVEQNYSERINQRMKKTLRQVVKDKKFEIMK